MRHGIVHLGSTLSADLNHLNSTNSVADQYKIVVF